LKDRKVLNIWKEKEKNSKQDLCTRGSIGYAFSEYIDTRLTLEALNIAVPCEQPQPGLVFHSDQGALASFDERSSRLTVPQWSSTRTSGIKGLKHFHSLRRLRGFAPGPLTVFLLFTAGVILYFFLMLLKRERF